VLPIQSPRDHNEQKGRRTNLILAEINQHMHLYGYELIDVPIIDSADLFLVKAGDFPFPRDMADPDELLVLTNWHVVNLDGRKAATMLRPRKPDAPVTSSRIYPLTPARFSAYHAIARVIPSSNPTRGAYPSSAAALWIDGTRNSISAPGCGL